MQGPRATLIDLAVVFGLLVIPRALQRFRLPAPLTCFAFGVIAAGFFKPLIGDSVIAYLATLGLRRFFSSQIAERVGLQDEGSLPGRKRGKESTHILRRK